MKKELKDYLHFYFGCDVQYQRFSEDLQMYVLVKRVLNEDCLLTIKMLYGEFSLIEVKPILRPLSDMTEQEYNEWDNIHPLITGTSELIISEAEKTKYLLSKNFDLFGLIDAGIAIDATTIKAEI